LSFPDVLRKACTVLYRGGLFLFDSIPVAFAAIGGLTFFPAWW